MPAEPFDPDPVMLYIVIYLFNRAVKEIRHSLQTIHDIF